MKKFLSMALVLAICGTATIAPMNVSAYEIRHSAEHMVIETEAFQYDSGGMSRYDSWDDKTDTDLGGYLNTNVVDDGYIVTGAFTYQNSGDKYYTLFMLNAPTELYRADGSVSEYLYNRCCIKAENLEEILGQKELIAGDIFEFEDYGVWGLGFEGCIKLSTPWISYDEDGNEIENATPPKYIGNALDMFGEEFEAVLENEMYLAPNSVIGGSHDYDVTSDNQFVLIGEARYKNLAPSDKVGYIVTGDNQIIKLGDVTIDEYISIVDALAVNQALVGVRNLDKYGELAGDVNHNGTLDDGDVMKILKFLVGLETLE